MDKYIKMLIISLSSRYKVILNHKIFYKDDTERLINIFTLTVYKKGVKKAVFRGDFYSKQAVVMELVKWQSATQNEKR